MRRGNCTNNKTTKEISLYRPLIEGALNEGWALWRVQDGSFGRKPADCAGISPSGVGVLLEVKVYDKVLFPGSRIPNQLLRFNQNAWLAEYARLKAYSLVAIYNDTLNEMWVFRILHPNQLERSTLVSELICIELKLDGKGRWVGWNQLL